VLAWQFEFAVIVNSHENLFKEVFVLLNQSFTNVVCHALFTSHAFRYEAEVLQFTTRLEASELIKEVSDELSG
jgi:hypothetical protein